jgi:hypothetical protein
MANTSTKKQFNKIKEGTAGRAAPPRSAKAPNRPGMNDGQMKGNAQADKFANPMNAGAPAAIIGFDKTYDDIGEKSGFITDGYMDKSGTPFGEAAKFNFLPPGMEINNQENAEINEMPLRILVDASYPGDGWTPAPRDMPE